METKLFKWRQMDFVSECVLQFYEIELVIDIGTQKAGTKYPMATIDYEKGILDLYPDKDQPSFIRYKLELKVI